MVSEAHDAHESHKKQSAHHFWYGVSFSHFATSISTHAGNPASNDQNASLTIDTQAYSVPCVHDPSSRRQQSNHWQTVGEELDA